ncbi:hypothetical protein F4859DRAFT_523021 [Xylaria cf. heliscus]|nr:hypothetical protein F4859DRAFT_523021 [Xylaria cf. heliscus]
MPSSDPARWDALDMIGDDGQDRRGKGKEIIPHPRRHLVTPSAHTRARLPTYRSVPRTNTRPETRNSDQKDILPIQDGYQDQATKKRNKSNKTQPNINMDGHKKVAKESKNPYVLVLYADLLLQQGDFKVVILLRGDPIFDLATSFPNSTELQPLRINWELIQLSAKSRALGTIDGVSVLFDEVTRVLSILKDRGRPIGSTEIKILGLTLQLTSRPSLKAEWLSQDRGIVLPTVSKHIYPTLLRQGRIWDFHDLLTLMPTIGKVNDILYGIFGTDLVRSLKTLIAQWTTPSHEDDSPTTLALLSILTHIVLEPIHTRVEHRVEIVKLSQPLAMSVLRCDRTNIRTRPYLRFLLANSQFTERGSHNGISSLVYQLRFSPGFSFHVDASYLPIYVPKETETPSWAVPHPHPEAKESAQLALRAASSFEYIKTEVLSLRELIRLSANPQKDFDKLCELQLAKGDLFGYGETLASRYLIAKTPSDKETLKKEITDVLSQIITSDLCGPYWRWSITMLMYKLHGRSLQQINYQLKTDFADYYNMNAKFLQRVLQKMPEFSDWAQQQLAYSEESQLAKPVLQPRTSAQYRSKVRQEDDLESQLSQETTRPNARSQNDSKSNKQPSESMQNSKLQHPQNDHEATSVPTSMENLWLADETYSDMVESRIRVSDLKRQQKELHELIEMQKRDRGHIANLEAENSALQRVCDKHKMDARRNTEAHEKQLEREKCARETAELERDEHKKKFAIVEAVTNENLNRMVKAMKSKEYEIETLRKAMTDIVYDNEKRLESALRRGEEEREKVFAKLSLDGERRINALISVQREKSVEIRNGGEWMSFKTTQTDKEEKVSLLAAQKPIEAAQTSEGMGSKLQERAEQEAKNQAETQERQRKLEIEEMIKAEALQNSIDKVRKQQQEESREEMRKWAADEVQRQANCKGFLHLTDARARKFVFPFERCKAWVGMQGLLNDAFRFDDDMRPHIQAGQYVLILDGAIILPQLWEDSAKPGSQITIKMQPIAGLEGTGLEFGPSPESSDFNIEHPRVEIHNSNSASLSTISLLGSSLRSGLNHPEDHIPGLVPEAPVSSYMRPASPAQNSQPIPLTRSRRRSSRVIWEYAGVDESPSRQSRQSNDISSYSIRSEMTFAGQRVDNPRPTGRLSGFLPNWRWKVFRGGVAMTDSSGSTSDGGGVRSIHESGEVEGQGG